MAQSRKRVGIAICGFGRAGNIHFNGIRSNHLCSLKYVVDRVDIDSVKKLIQDNLDKYMMDEVKLVGVECFETEVLKDTSVDAIVVTTPTDYHEFYVRKSLAAGKAVFCEKPVAANLKAIAEVYDLAERVKLPLFCAFNRRFDSGMSSVRRQVKDGKIGTIYHIKTTSRDSPLPSIAYLKISNGIFHDCAVHDIDLVCWIVGEEPCGVFAQGTAFDPDIREIGDVDTVAIVLKFPSGILATIDLSRHSQYGYDQRLEVLGSKGMLQVKNVLNEPVACFDGVGVLEPPLQFSFPQRYKDAYRLEMDSFVSAVLDPASSTVLVTKRDVLLCGRIAEACERSLKEGKMICLDQ